MDKKICLLTNDVETTSIWHNSLRDDTGKRVLEEGMPLLLELYAQFNIKSTFFFTGYIASLYPGVVKMILPYGHEIASHGMSHIRKNGFDVMPFEKQKKHLSESKKILEDLSGQEVVSFRAPALRVNNLTVKALEETGYSVDSSVASQRFDMFMSFGGLKKLNWLTAPRLPYRASSKSLFKKGNSAIVEVPLSATLLPYIGTTLRIFPTISILQRKLLAFESSVRGKPIVFDVHPNEYIDESHEEREFQRRAKNRIAGFVQDTIRSRLKVKNLGLSGLELYKREIDCFKKDGFEFMTVKDYVQQINI